MLFLGLFIIKKCMYRFNNTKYILLVGKLKLTLQKHMMTKKQKIFLNANVSQDNVYVYDVDRDFPCFLIGGQNVGIAVQEYAASAQVGFKIPLLRGDVSVVKEKSKFKRNDFYYLSLYFFLETLSAYHRCNLILLTLVVLFAFAHCN